MQPLAPPIIDSDACRLLDCQICGKSIDSGNSNI